MKTCFALFAVCGALTVTTAPALADVTYQGHFTGTFTSGYSYIDVGDGCNCHDVADLTGMPLEIDFIAQQIDAFTDSAGVIHHDYETVSASFVLPNWTIPISASNIEMPIWWLIQDASYVGNSTAATIHVAWLDTGGGADGGFGLSFSGAGTTPGPLTGSGHAADRYILGPVRDSYFGFDLLSGYVRNVTPVAPVPEPGAWAMMVAGFGFAGAALRRGAGARASRSA